MAFKILSEEEKLFMTEKQLEVYEKELRLYKERLAFVEQVEKMESAEIKKFTPSLRPIGEISSPELAPFENKGIGRIELKKTAAKVPDTELYAARTISKTDITGFIKATAHIMDRAGLNKELGGSLAEKASSAGRLGTRNISISKKAIRAFAQRSFDSSVAERKAELTKKPVAEFDIRSFAAPERKVPELKKTSIAPMTAREFAKPALSAVQLDMPARASVFSSAVTMPERAAVKLSMPEKASVFSSAVTMPERSAVKLSVPAKAAVPAAEFRLAALSAPKLERRPVRKYDGRRFAMPALSRPELKTVTAAAPKLSSFEAKAVRAELDMPETMPALKLVDFHKPEVSAKVSKKAVPEIKSAEFEMPEIKAPNLVKSSRPEVKIGSFNAPEMPEIRLSVNVSPVKHEFTVKSMPEVKAEIRKPEIISGDRLDFSKLNFMAGFEKRDTSALQESIISKTEKIKSMDLKGLQDSVLSAFKNDIKGTEV